MLCPHLYFLFSMYHTNHHRWNPHHNNPLNHCHRKNHLHNPPIRNCHHRNRHFRNHHLLMNHHCPKNRLHRSFHLPNCCLPNYCLPNYCLPNHHWNLRKNFHHLHLCHQKNCLIHQKHHCFHHLWMLNLSFHYIISFTFFIVIDLLFARY